MTDDPTRAGVAITLDRPRTLQYHAFAFLRYQDEFKRELLEDLQSVYNRFQEARKKQRDAKEAAAAKAAKVAAKAAAANAGTDEEKEAAAQEAAAEAEAKVVLQVGIPIAEINGILWAGLLEDDETLTPMQVARLFGMGDFAVILPKISEAIVKVMGEARPTIEPVQPKLKSGQHSGLTSAPTSESTQASAA